MATRTPTPPGTRRGGTVPSRRDLLSAGIFTGLTGIGIAAFAKPDTEPAKGAHRERPSSDAQLIAIGREVATLLDQRKPLEAQWWALPSDTRSHTPDQARTLNAVSEALQPIDDRLDELIDCAIPLRAGGLSAMSAKAMLIRYEMEISHVTEGEMDLGGLEPHERVMWSLLADLTEEAL